VYPFFNLNKYMKKSDLIFVLCILSLVLPFVCSSAAWNAFESLTHAHPYMMAFVKFAILSTIGEILGVRLKTNQYLPQGFGLIPRMIVWGFLGIAIASAMSIFAIGTPALLEKYGVEGAFFAMGGNFSALKLLGAFSISCAMNLIFGPIFMTLHKITDTHIDQYNGTLEALKHPIAFGKILKNLNWDVQYNFVFKKTIPFFWIPAHTLTFLMPPTVQVLLAASYGIVLGVLLSLAANMSKTTS